MLMGEIPVWDSIPGHSEIDKPPIIKSTTTKINDNSDEV